MTSTMTDKNEKSLLIYIIIKDEVRRLAMKKLSVIFLLLFILIGCSNENGENNKKTEDSTLQSIEQDERDYTETTTEIGELTNEMNMSSEDINVSEELTTEMYTTEQLANVESDYYAICTTYSKEEIEMFAKTIKSYILNKEWDKLADKVSYPITIGNSECKSQDEFKRVAFDNILTDGFYAALENETCEDMFCNYQGIMLGNGQVWFAEIIDSESGKGELMVIAINP